MTGGNGGAAYSDPFRTTANNKYHPDTEFRRNRKAISQQGGGFVLTLFLATMVFVMGTSVVRFEYGLGSSSVVSHALVSDVSEWTVNHLDASSSTIHEKYSMQGSPLQERQNSRASVKNDVPSSKSVVNSKLKGGNAVGNKGDNPLLSLFRDAGVNLQELTTDVVASLPKEYENMQELFGDLSTPVVVGMDTCQAYRDSVPVKQRYTAVAGLFNTGTNAMEYHLRTNVKLASKWQVPWGKHRVPSVRLTHIAPGMEKANKEYALPIVVLRDPFTWMQSMCKSPYAAKWKHTKLHCPNLVPTQQDIGRFGKQEMNGGFNVTVFFDKNQVMHWDNLIHLYNDWYSQYLNAEYPRLMVRFEDMLVQAPALLQQIADCAGTRLTHQNTTTKEPIVRYQIESAKSHGSHTGFVKAVLKAGDKKKRLHNLTPEDIEFSSQHFNATLLQTFRYTVPVAHAT